MEALCNMISAVILIIFASETAAEWMITSELINYPLGPIYRCTSALLPGQQGKLLDRTDEVQERSSKAV